MSLTPQELLIPRVICIGGKDGEPNDTSGDFISGDILTQTVKSIHKWRSEKLKHSVYLDPDCAIKFPHLFHPLHWSEFREVEDMPHYVWIEGKVFKTALWDYDNDVVYVFEGECTTPLMIQSSLPATREEWEAQQQQTAINNMMKDEVKYGNRMFE